MILRCLDYQLNPANGKREEFDVIVDNPKDLQRCKLSEKCDITIEGPWLSFPDKNGTKGISNGFLLRLPLCKACFLLFHITLVIF